MKIAAVIMIAASLAGCSQWGTSILRPTDVWWACPDRGARCSPEAAALTLIQMDNTFWAVRRDVERLQGFIPERASLRIQAQLEAASAARSRVTSFWGPALADYVAATVRAERLTERYLGKLGGI